MLTGMGAGQILPQTKAGPTLWSQLLYNIQSGIYFSVFCSMFSGDKAVTNQKLKPRWVQGDLLLEMLTEERKTYPSRPTNLMIKDYGECRMQNAMTTGV